MRRPERAISREQALEILQRCNYGILSTADAQGTPYGVPLNYCYLPEENCIFFHCAKKGKKLFNIAENPRVSFVVIGYEHIVPHRYITHYESAILTGHACLVEDDAERRQKLRILSERLASDAPERREQVIEQYFAAVHICKVYIDDITGKRNRDDE